MLTEYWPLDKSYTSIHFFVSNFESWIVDSLDILCYFIFIILVLNCLIFFFPFCGRIFISSTFIGFSSIRGIHLMLSLLYGLQICKQFSNHLVLYPIIVFYICQKNFLQMIKIFILYHIFLLLVLWNIVSFLFINQQC